MLHEWKSLRRTFEHVIGKDLLAAAPETRETGAERPLHSLQLGVNGR
jgi:hypothetical protein